MDNEVLFITMDGCPFCMALKKAWKPLFEQGIIKEIKVSTPEGREIAEKLGLKYVPACIIKIGDKLKFCEGDEIHKKV
jgi:glutaredoxin